MDVNHSAIVKCGHYGNGLVAKCDLEPGQVIIQITNPLLLVVEEAALGTVCAQCFFQSDRLKKCAGCQVVQYCSKYCQRAAWKSTHKRECPIYRSLPQIVPTVVRGLIQLILAEPENNRTLSQSPWADLEAHIPEIKAQKERWENIILQTRAAVEWTKSPDSYMDGAAEVLCLMETNGFRVTLADNTPIGLCFEPVISFANHSCTPNSTVMFDGRRVILRALDTIKSGDQIFISYIDPTQTRSERRAQLQDQYFFTCHCDKCETDAGAYHTFLIRKPIPYYPIDCFVSQESLHAFARAICSNSLESKPLSRESLLLLHAGSKTKLNLRWSYLLNQPAQFEDDIFSELYTYNTNLHTGRGYLKALIVGLFIYLHSDVYNYPQAHHPVRVVRLLEISRLCRWGAQRATNPDTVATFPALGEIDWISAYNLLILITRDLAIKSHGSDTRFMKEIEENVKDVEEVQSKRGILGEVLREWVVSGEVLGEQYARRIFEQLKTLADQLFTVFDEL